jgi:hypothetical protein
MTANSGTAHTLYDLLILAGGRLVLRPLARPPAYEEFVPDIVITSQEQLAGLVGDRNVTVNFNVMSASDHTSDPAVLALCTSLTRGDVK